MYLVTIIGNGTLSPIHLHNAPAGANGPVVVDVFTDAASCMRIVGITETIDPSRHRKCYRFK